MTMSVMHSIRRPGPLLLAAAIGLAGFSGTPAVPAAAPHDDLSSHPMLNQSAPDFNLTSIAGSSVRLSELRGEYVVIHFATTWCPYCNAEAPSLQRLHDTYAEQGVRVLVVDVMEDREKVVAWARRLKWSIPVLLDTDGEATRRYAPDILPELPREEVPIASNLLIDRDGKIQFYSLLDSRNFDVKLSALESRLTALMDAER
jgi:peroxiredoxin